MAIIYHYCSPETFHKIIENKTLWLSATNNMNDFSEGKWVESVLAKVLSDNHTDDNNEWCNNLWRTVVGNNQIAYVSCFSKEGDTLSQWRAYAQDGEGVAIGFDEDKLGLGSGMPIWHAAGGVHSIKLNEIEYIDTHELQREIKSIIFKKGVQYINNVNHLLEITAKINHLSMTVKNLAFEEEKEKRIIYKALIMTDKENRTIQAFPSIGDVKYRISNGYLTSYFDFKFNSNVIKEIILGPKNKFSQYDIETFLSINGLTKANVGRSTATYR